MQRKISINATVCKNVDFSELITMLENILAFLKELLMKLVNESFESVGT